MRANETSKCVSRQPQLCLGALSRLPKKVIVDQILLQATDDHFLRGFAAASRTSRLLAIEAAQCALQRDSAELSRAALVSQAARSSRRLVRSDTNIQLAARAERFLAGFTPPNYLYRRHSVADLKKAIRFGQTPWLAQLRLADRYRLTYRMGVPTQLDGCVRPRGHALGRPGMGDLSRLPTDLLVPHILVRATEDKFLPGFSRACRATRQAAIETAEHVLQRHRSNLYDVAQQTQLGRRKAEVAVESPAPKQAEYFLRGFTPPDYLARGLRATSCLPALHDDDLQRTRSQIQKAIEIGQSKWRANLGLGDLCRAAGDMEAALLHYRCAQDEHPQGAEPAYKVGLALFELQQWPEAKAALRQAVQLKHGDYPSAQTLLMKLHLQMCNTRSFAKEFRNIRDSAYKISATLLLAS